MPELISKAAVLKIIFDSIGKPATEIYQKVRELPAAAAPELAGWVRASERMPELGPWEPADEEGTAIWRHSKPVQAIKGDGETALAQYEEEKWSAEDPPHFQGWETLPDLSTFRDVIWWAPTPEPPKDGGQDDGTA